MMKKIALILALCLTLCVTFCACGNEGTDSSVDIIGSWTLSTIIDAEGTEYTLEEYCAANGVDSEGLELTYTFNEDGTGTADIGGIGTEITYKIDGNTVIVTTTANGQAANFTYEGDSLCAEDAASGMKSILTK